MINVKTSHADRFTQIIDHFQLSDHALGLIAGVTGTGIAKIKQGKTANPRLKLLTNISRELGVSMKWLLSGEGPMLTPAETDHEAGAEPLESSDKEENMAMPQSVYLSINGHKTFLVTIEDWVWVTRKINLIEQRITKLENGAK